jgi:hypothetical protein
MSQKNEGGCFTRQKHLFDLRSLHTELFVRLTSSGKTCQWNDSDFFYNQTLKKIFIAN